MIRVAIVEDFALLREDLWELIGEQKDMETVNAGILAAEQIRDQGKGQQVIFLTAHETDQTIITAMGTGAVDYIVKGCQEQEILRHIRNAYKGKPVMDKGDCLHDPGAEYLSFVLILVKGGNRI